MEDELAKNVTKDLTWCVMVEYIAVIFVVWVSKGAIWRVDDGKSVYRG